MIEQTPRDPWRATWTFVTNDYVIAVLLLGIAAGLAISAGLPQMRNSDPIAYARWRSEVQARFGDATPTMETLGLFTITRSLVFRLLLALLAGCLLLQLIERADGLRQHRELATPVGEWQSLPAVCLPDVLDDLRQRRYRVITVPPLFQADRWPWADVFPILVRGGALLVLAGLLVTHLWGWQVEGLIVQGGERVTLPNSRGWIALDEDGAIATHSPGIVTFFEERGPGVEANAVSDTARPLPLQQTTDAEPVTQLTVALTEDQYFAIPEAQLIVRLTPQPGHPVDANSPVAVQIYRSPTGRLTTETVVEGDIDLIVGDVTLKLTSVPYARLTATFNPGLWPTGVGLVFLLVGALGGVALPPHRFWLREGSEHPKGSGDIPATWTEDREA